MIKEHFAEEGSTVSVGAPLFAYEAGADAPKKAEVPKEGTFSSLKCVVCRPLIFVIVIVIVISVPLPSPLPGVHIEPAKKTEQAPKPEAAAPKAEAPKTAAAPAAAAGGGGTYDPPRPTLERFPSPRLEAIVIIIRRGYWWVVLCRGQGCSQGGGPEGTCPQDRFPRRWR